MNWYLKVIRNYAVFTGRAGRREYWMFILFNVIFGIIAGLLDRWLGLYFARMGYGVISGLYSLFVFIPTLAVTMRRLHDTDRSGWWVLISLIPIVGQIWLLVLMILDSQPGTNRYGHNPKTDQLRAEVNL